MKARKNFWPTAIRTLGVWLFWLSLWFMAAWAMDLALLLPSPVHTASALWALVITPLFWKSLALSMLRILIGILLSLVIGTLLAILTSVSSLCRALFTPLINAMKSVPVACFIVLVFLWMNTASIPIFITSLIVIPIVWSNVMQGIASTDVHLREVTKIFGFSRAKTLRTLYVPSVFPYFLAACQSALGMAWKAGIAAEVLAPPLFGIGKGIYLAKTDFDSATLFAWTFVIVLISYAVEKLFVFLLHRGARSLHLHMGGDGHADT